MEIVVNDTNIFIDLHSIELLEQFFEMPITVHTVDFIINELKDPKQINAIQKYIDNGKLTVGSFSNKELIQIYNLHNTTAGNVSIPDCAVWHYAKKNNYTLLTGDRQLRDNASNSNVTVKGIIFIFDSLIENNILSSEEAIYKIQDLLKINPRLPKKIIQERIEKWSE